MLSILMALASALAWGVSDFLGGLYTRRLRVAPVLLISQLVGFALLVTVAALLRGVPTLGPAPIGFAMAASASGLLGIAALYRGMAAGLVSIVAPISATGAALPVIFGLTRGERAAPLQMLGIVLALAGIVLASRPAPSASDSSQQVAARGVGLALVAALGFGGFFILLHEAAVLDVLWASTFQRLTGVAILTLVVLAFRTPIAVPARLLPSLILIGVLDTGANVLYAFASTSGMVSVAAVLASLFPVATVILARVVLHERLARIQASGVVLALTGVALIAWNPG